MELREVRRLAEQLIAEHGLEGWTFAFDRAVRRAGKCSYGTRTISLSAPLARLHDEVEVTETLLHEIAHALTPGEGHSATWRRVALRIGSSGERCVDSAAPSVPGDWVGVCGVGHRVERHRAPQRVVSCSKCSPRFSTDHLFTWTHRTGRALPVAYRLELDRIAEGRPRVAVGVGGRVRIVVPGDFHGVEGRVVKCTRASYVVRTREHGLLKLPLAGAVPA